MNITNFQERGLLPHASQLLFAIFQQRVDFLTHCLGPMVVSSMNQGILAAVVLPSLVRAPVDCSHGSQVDQWHLTVAPHKLKY